jgi:hypothetical protein
MPRSLNPRERALGTQCIDLVRPRAGLDDMEKRKFLTLLGLQLRLLGRPASSYTDYATPAPMFLANCDKISIMALFRRHI